MDDCEVGDLAVSAITLGELEAGYAKSEDPDGARREAASALVDIEVVPEPRIVVWCPMHFALHCSC